MPILHIGSVDENQLNILLAVPGSGIDITFIPDPDIVEEDNEVTYTFEDHLIIKTTRIENEYQLSLEKTIGGTIITYKEMMDEDSKNRLRLLIEEHENIGDAPPMNDGAVGAPVTSIERDQNILRLITSPGYGFGITFVPGTAVFGEGADDRVWTLPGVDNTITIDNVHGPDILRMVFLKINGIESIIFMEEALIGTLIAILNTPAAVGGYRRRHRKTKRRQPKKKRTRKARK